MKTKIIPWILVILWMTLIFNLSHQQASKSNRLSKGATQVIVDTVQKVAPNISFNKISFNNILRKNAHFFACFVLGILVASALGSMGAFVGIMIYKFFKRARGLAR